MNDHICQLMVNHLNLNNDKDFGFLLIKSIKNGSITIKDVYPELKPILYHIANNQEKFDADVDIYGKFMDKYNFIESKMSKL